MPEGRPSSSSDVSHSHLRCISTAIQLGAVGNPPSAPPSTLPSLPPFAVPIDQAFPPLPALPPKTTARPVSPPNRQSPRGSGSVSAAASVAGRTTVATAGIILHGRWLLFETVPEVIGFAAVGISTLSAVRGTLSFGASTVGVGIALNAHRSTAIFALATTGSGASVAVASIAGLARCRHSHHLSSSAAASCRGASLLALRSRTMLATPAPTPTRRVMPTWTCALRSSCRASGDGRAHT